MYNQKVSVVIATYNRSVMVCEAVEAAWDQSLKPDEIIVSDDCSPDSTLLALENLKNSVPVLKVITTTKNTGGVLNWNHVINSCSGDIIAWCSDDDKFEFNHLESALKYLNDNPDVALVHSSFINVSEYEDGSRIESKTALKSNAPLKISRRNLLVYSSENFNWPFHPSTLVFRRKVWDEVGEFNPRFEIADTDWFIRCARLFNIAYLPYYGVRNRRHFGASGNWSNRVGSAKMQRELRESIFNFYNAEICNEDIDYDIESQLRIWLYRYRILLLRIFIARCRAGSHSASNDVATEMLQVTRFLALIPRPIRIFAVRSVFHMLSALQTILPGGKSKYHDLGRHVPL
jgi:glycosyltransferase involved in cell wall biosynthesis